MKVKTFDLEEVKKPVEPVPEVELPKPVIEPPKPVEEIKPTPVPEPIPVVVAPEPTPVPIPVEVVAPAEPPKTEDKEVKQTLNSYNNFMKQKKDIDSQVEKMKAELKAEMLLELENYLHLDNAEEYVNDIVVENI